jgi:hypothetical protein
LKDAYFAADDERELSDACLEQLLDMRRGEGSGATISGRDVSPSHFA